MTDQTTASNVVDLAEARRKRDAAIAAKAAPADDQPVIEIPEELIARIKAQVLAGEHAFDFAPRNVGA